MKDCELATLLLGQQLSCSHLEVDMRMMVVIIRMVVMIMRKVVKVNMRMVVMIMMTIML